MKLFQYLDRINMMHKLLNNSSTGTPEEFAQQLGISRSSLYELIDELKSRKAPIRYSKSAKTFYYEEPFEILITCDLHPMTYQEEKEYSAGHNLSKILFSRTMMYEISNVSLLC
jgi:hypothetical protein